MTPPPNNNQGEKAKTYPLACECGGEFSTRQEFDKHLKSDFKEHPIQFGNHGFEKGIKK